jgi:hypothetical protein
LHHSHVPDLKAAGASLLRLLGLLVGNDGFDLGS